MNLTLKEAAGEMLKLIENSDWENDDDAPINEDMNRWHNAVADAIILDDRITELEHQAYQAYHPDEINYQRRHRRWALRKLKEQFESHIRLADYKAYANALKREKKAADQRADKAGIEVGRLMAQRDKLFKACEKAKQFIENGVENGYIHLPDKPDPALDTLPQICAAIAKTKGAALEKNPKE